MEWLILAIAIHLACGWCGYLLNRGDVCADWTVGDRTKKLTISMLTGCVSFVIGIATYLNRSKWFRNLWDASARW